MIACLCAMELGVLDVDASVELEALGWYVASAEEAYTVCRGPLQGQDTLLCLVAVEGRTVRVAVPLAAQDSLPEDTEKIEMEVRLAQVRNRTRVTTTKVKVLCIDLPVEAVLEYPEATIEKTLDGCLTFCARDARMLPYAYDLVPGGAAGLEDGTAAVVPAIPGEGMVADLLGAVQKLVDRVETLEEQGGPPAASRPAGPPGRRSTPFLEAAGPVLPIAAQPGIQPQRGTLFALDPGTVTPEVLTGPAANPLAPLAAALAALVPRPSGNGYEMNAAPAASEEELRRLGLGADAPRLGAAQLERLLLTRREQPALVIKSHEEEIKRDLGVLSTEPWSYERHARELAIPAAEGAEDLRKSLAILARAVDYHRAAEPLQAHAFLLQAYKAAHGAALHPDRRWDYLWPLLGLKDPDAAGRPSLAPAEYAALAAYHRDQEVIHRQLGIPPSGARSAIGGGRGSGGGNNPKGGAIGRGKGGREEPQDEGDLRTQLDRLKRDLAEERKKVAKAKGKAGGKGKDKEPPQE